MRTILQLLTPSTKQRRRGRDFEASYPATSARRRRERDQLRRHHDHTRVDAFVGSRQLEARACRLGITGDDIDQPSTHGGTSGSARPRLYRTTRSTDCTAAPNRSSPRRKITILSLPELMQPPVGARHGTRPQARRDRRWQRGPVRVERGRGARRHRARRLGRVASHRLLQTGRPRHRRPRLRPAPDRRAR